MTTKAGRKPLHENKKDRKITIAFTAAEGVALESDAAMLGRSLAEYLHARLYAHSLVIVPAINKEAWVQLAELAELLKPLLRAIEASEERGLLAPQLVLSILPMIDRLQDALISAATALDQDKKVLDSIDSGLSGY